MKITSFQLTIQQGVDEQGYGDNFYVNIDDKGMATISRPYKSIPIEEQLAIEEVLTSAIKAHIKLVKQIDNANKDLRLEEYRPIESVAEEPSETTSEAAVSQSCALGDEELSTGAITIDEARTPEEMLEAMIASGERKEVRDLPM